MEDQLPHYVCLRYRARLMEHLLNGKMLLAKAKGKRSFSLKVTHVTSAHILLTKAKHMVTSKNQVVSKMHMPYFKRQIKIIYNVKSI